MNSEDLKALRTPLAVLVTMIALAGGGVDSLLGGAGADTMIGGAGDDVILAGGTSLQDIFNLFAL